MNISFELSKEHHHLPIAEIQSVLQAEQIPYKIQKKTEDILICSTTKPSILIEMMSRRLSHTFTINNHFFSCENNTEDLQQNARNHPLPTQGSVAIRYRNRSTHLSSKTILTALAEIYTQQRTVCLTKPDIEIRVLITDEELHVGQMIKTIDRSSFQTRKAQHRPFFSPISLDPLLARLLVNLSKIPTSGILLDPFCGTGGILIEAGLMDISLIGCDIKKKMIMGTQQNLMHFDLSSRHLYQIDIGKLDETISKPVDAVVTDFPYGKATTTNKEQISKLYPRAFQQISKVLKKGSYAVIGIPNEKYSTYAIPFLQLVAIYPIRVHRSLTRYFIIYQK